jgi:hypothetical protein
MQGSCTIISAEETPGGMAFSSVRMEPAWSITSPRGSGIIPLPQKDTKMVLIEDSSTGHEQQRYLQAHRGRRGKNKGACLTIQTAVCG